MRFLVVLAVLLGMTNIGSAATGGLVAGDVRHASYQVALRKSRFQGDVYLFRGLGNIFSLGMDQLGRKLVARGINAKVVHYGQWRAVANTIIRHRKKYGRVPVVLIGHSYGADVVVKIARELQRRRIRVTYAVTFEPTVKVPVPSNVGKFVNYYLSDSSFGVALEKAKGRRGYFRNIDVVSKKGVTHFNIDSQDSLHKTIIKNVLRYVRPKKRRKTALLQ